MRAPFIILLALTTTASAQALKRTPEEAALVKAIKRAERANFEKHDTDKYMALFTPDAVWTFGRADKPGDYDFTLSYGQRQALAAFRNSTVLTAKESVYFNEESVRVDGETGTYSAIVERHFFGGVDAFNTRYSAKKTPAGWRVHAVRAWPARQMIGGEPRVYDDPTYKELDEAVTQSPKDDFRLKFTSLVTARRYVEARQAAEAATKKFPNDHHAWAALSAVLIELGEIEAAKQAADQARKIEPSANTPFDRK